MDWQKTVGKLKRQAEERKAAQKADKLGLPYLDLAKFPVSDVEIVDEEKAREANLCVINKTGQKLKIALLNPEDEKTKKLLAELKKQGFKISLFIVSQSSLVRALEKYRELARPKEPTKEKILLAQKEVASLKQLEEKILRLPTTEILNIILLAALKNDASDVHFEPTEANIRLRFRIDGLLEDIAKFPKKAYRLILSRVKLISKLKLNVCKVPQNGRFSVLLDKVKIEIRTSTLPGPNGETITLRLLNPKFLLNLEQLGLGKKDLVTMEEALKKKTGMILVTGPTGCGKTTTLYACLEKINRPEVKIITLEEPIEYHLKGISQTQVEPKKGYTFATGLKDILRQDPDVILLGEIRDLETAQTAFRAALTGHLVFSTLHTNDAAGAIPRLLDLGLKPEQIAPALNIIITQRLVRRVNQKSPSGYKGRIAIFELLPIDEEMEKLILTSPSYSFIKQKAIKKGMKTMRKDGEEKVKQGITDRKELERVVGE